jgi:hypothetical protein
MPTILQASNVISFKTISYLVPLQFSTDARILMRINLSGNFIPR